LSLAFTMMSEVHFWAGNVH